MSPPKPNLGQAFTRALWLYVTVRLPLEVALVLTTPGIPAGGGCTDESRLDGPAILHRLFRWDSGWYISIIRDGYSLGPPGQQSSIVFFPLYPMISKALMALGLPMTVSMLLVSHLALIAALAAFFALGSVLEKFDPAPAALALLVFPTSFFLSAAYTESLFVMLSLWGLYFFEKRQAGWALVIAALVVLCRANGVVTVGALGLGALLRKDWKLAVALTVGAALSLGGYTLFQAQVLHDPLAFLHAREGWKGQIVQYIVETYHGVHLLHGWIDVASMGWLAVTGYLAWKHLGPAYGAMCLGTLALPLLGGQVWSFSRIALCGVPAFLVFGKRELDPRLARALVVIGTSLCAINAYRFVNCHWVS